MFRFVLPAAILCLFASPARALSIVPSSNANDLASALTAGGGSGLVVTGATLVSHTMDSASSSGTFTNADATYSPLLTRGVVLSTGNVLDYATGPNTRIDKSTLYNDPATPDQQALLDPITGAAKHYDVTDLTITFDMQPGFDTAFFNAVFGSEEFPEFVQQGFNDGFGLYVNGTNIATVDGLPVNINHPGMTHLAGTELDGILGSTPVHTFSAIVGEGSKDNVLKFIIADTRDPQYDSTVYLSQLGGTLPPPPDGDAAIVSEPITLLAAMAALTATGIYTRRRFAEKH